MIFGKDRDFVPKESRNLLAHKRFQRRNNHAHTRPQNGGQLKTEALAEPGRADNEHGLPAQSCLDNRQLAVAKSF
jgi:hypothetical protein